MPDAARKWCHWFEDEMEEDYLDAGHAQAYSHLRRLLEQNERLEAELAKKTRDFRAFREARIGHDYITHSEELEADRKAIEAKYYELLWGVATKHPEETRHETALRYILEHERGNDETVLGEDQEKR